MKNFKENDEYEYLYVYDEPPAEPTSLTWTDPTIYPTTFGWSFL